MQKGENIIYADHFILGQIIPAANVPEDIEVYECAENELKIIRPLCSKTTGEFKELKKHSLLSIFAEMKTRCFFIMVSIKRS